MTLMKPNSDRTAIRITESAFCAYDHYIAIS